MATAVPTMAMPVKNGSKIKKMPMPKPTMMEVLKQEQLYQQKTTMAAAK